MAPGKSSIDHSALASIAASLNDAIERLGAIARQGGEDDEIASELLEVERQLSMSCRRLDKAVRNASR